jgi:hypothetical protein
MTRRLLTGSPLIALLALTAGLATQAMAGLLDGGFEIPTPSSSVGYTGDLGDGWTVTQGTIGIQNTADGFGAVPHSGNQYAYLDWNNTLNTVSQNLTTVLGQSYLVSYWVADSAPNTLSVKFGSQVLFNGVAPTNGVGLASDYVNYNYTVTASSTSASLSITGQWLSLPGAYGTILDDVSVTPVSSSAPEPATLGFTGLGCLALFALRRKQFESPA